MNKEKFEHNKKSTTVTLTGVIIMLLLTVTKIIPSSQIAGLSVIVGIVFFFIAEAVAKKQNPESGLRFKTIAADLKKQGVIILLLLPTVSGILTLIVGNLLFHGEFVTHLLGRTSNMLSFDKIAVFAGQIIIAAFGEEIAYRGFFFGKSSKIFPVLPCMIVSSAVFAAGHIAAGNFGLVAYDVATIFIDSLIYTMVYHKSGNCVISTFSHILSNSVSIAVAVAFFRY